MLGSVSTNPYCVPWRLNDADPHVFFGMRIVRTLGIRIVVSSQRCAVLYVSRMSFADLTAASLSEAACVLTTPCVHSGSSFAYILHFGERPIIFNPQIHIPVTPFRLAINKVRTILLV